MQAVAQSWLMLSLTGSAAALGLSSALQYGPTLLLGPYAGVLADRFPKRKILRATQSASGLLALLLGIAVYTGSVRVWMVYAMAAALGVVTAIDHPTRQSFVYELVGRRQLISAVGLNSMAANVARIAGPALAGAAIAAVGMAPCFFVNAASYAFVLACLAGMRAEEFHGTRVLRVESGGGLREGLAYACKTPVVREVLVITAVVGVLAFEFSVTLPAFAKLSLSAGAGGLAYLMTAMGVGATLGGLLTASRRGDGLGRFTAASLAFGICTALVGFAPTLHVAAALMFFVGVFSARFTGLSNAILQLRASSAMRNRVMALWSTAFLGSSFFGGPLVGWIAELAGPRSSLFVAALGGVIAAVVGFAEVRRSRAENAESLAENNVTEIVTSAFPAAGESRSA